MLLEIGFGTFCSNLVCARPTQTPSWRMANTNGERPRRRKVLCVGVHLVWSTRLRTPCLTADIRPALFRYLSGMLSARRGRLLAGGGWTDHIHLYVDLPAGVSLATLISELKTASTGWLRRTYPEANFIGWQRSYAAFSVDRRRDERLMRYILDQETIHHQRSLHQEARTLFRAYGVANPDDLGD